MRLGVISARLVDASAVILVLGLLGCVVLGVVFRAIGDPLVWSDELAQHLLVWCGFAGMMIAARNGSHIRINMFVDMLPRRARLAAEIVIQLSIVAFALALMWYVPSVIQRNLDIEFVSLPISAALLYIPVPIAAFALIVQAFVDIGRALGGRLPHAMEPGSHAPGSQIT